MHNKEISAAWLGGSMASLPDAAPPVERSFTPARLVGVVGRADGITPIMRPTRAPGRHFSWLRTPLRGVDTQKIYLTLIAITWRTAARAVSTGRICLIVDLDPLCRATQRRYDPSFSGVRSTPRLYP